MSLFDESKPALTIAELSERVGQEIGVSRWFLIDQKRIDAFADSTEDWQFIHVDPEAAKATPFGSTVAHGFLTLSMLSAIAYDALPRVAGLAMGVNYGFEKVRFVAPVRAGRRIRGRFRLEGLTQRSAREYQSRKAVTVEIEGEDKPALVAEWLSLYVLTE
jgi:acyl dehydratase